MKNKHVDFYMNQVKKKEIMVSKYILLLFQYLKKYVLSRDDVYFNHEQHENYIKFTEKHYFKLEPFQKFISAFVFLYFKDGDYPYFPQFFIYLSRGAGKNGLISSVIHFLISDLHGIKNYDVSIVANSEEQAETSFKEIYGVIENAGKGSAMQDQFLHRKSLIQSKTNGSTIKYNTSNASTKDSKRDGAVVYDEVHEYVNGEIVDVFSSGLGKVPNSREFFITTDGFVRNGYLDEIKERAMNVLEGKAPEDRLFCFMATLDNPSEMNDEKNWQKANPMFHEPMSGYAKELYRIVREQYIRLGNSKPSARLKFMTKRMNLPSTDLETSVATLEELKATDRPLGDLINKSCVGGLDFASVRDFVAVGLLFKKDDEYKWLSHSFVNKNFLDRVEMNAPIDDWEQQGLLTIVDEPVINVKNVVDWFVEMRELYGVTTIVADTFRLDLVKTALEAEGFKIMYVRTKGIEALLAPRVETIFAEKRVIFGDNPLMRWYTNNVKVITDKKGNRTYGKKEEIKRKTDGFMAFIHALYRDDLIDEEMDFMLGNIKF